MRFATGGQRATVMRIHNDSWIMRGADVRFLSCYPAEEESLFAPLTYLTIRPSAGPLPTVTTRGNVQFSVIEVDTRQVAG